MGREGLALGVAARFVFRLRASQALLVRVVLLAAQDDDRQRERDGDWDEDRDRDDDLRPSARRVGEHALDEDAFASGADTDQFDRHVEGG